MKRLRLANRLWWVWLLCSFVSITAVVPQVARAQNAKSQLAPAAQTQMGEAAKQGFPLKTNSVSANVSVEAVLLPASVSSKVFGKEIAKSYAAIELTISNRSSDAGLIVHSILIDYKEWLLGGYVSEDDKCSPEYRLAKEKKGTSDQSKPDTTCQLQSWQAQTSPNQIASVEYRVARGQLLDTQPWTRRNSIIRGLQAIGSIATAYSFTIGGIHAVRSISAFNGEAVPAIETFWPDSTVGQMNRISDFGFQVNKVIPKDSSDIIVAFFPIDRFITPGLKKLFLKSPALFFSPYAMLLDPTALKLLEPITSSLYPDLKGKSLTDNLVHNLLKSRGHPSLATNDDANNFMHGISLNTVHVIVGGTMTVDVDNVAPKIDSVEIGGADATPPIWEQKGDITGVIKGSYLSGGSPVILEAGKFGISNVTAVAEGSTDSELHFKITLTKAIQTDQILTFTVKKTDKQSKSLVSPPYQFSVTYTPTPPKDAGSGDASSTPGADKTKDQTPTTPSPPGTVPATKDLPQTKKKPN